MSRFCPRIARVLSLSCALATLPFAGAALEPRPATAATEDTAGTQKILEVGVGTSRVLSLSEAVTRVAVADDKTAQITLVSDREILVQGLAIGRTTLFIWINGALVDGYLVCVQRDLGALREALAMLSGQTSVEESPDGRHIILKGDIPDRTQEIRAVEQAERFVQALPEPRPTVISLLRSSPEAGDADSRLAAALRVVDPRIRVRRVQVGNEAKHESDSFVLEGRVRTLSDLERAITLAERQLGSPGSKVGAKDNTSVRLGSAQSGIVGRNRGNRVMGDSTSVNSPDTDVGAFPPGLASQVSRRMMISSESGRVLSFLEVDRIEQILVSIRVYEIDRGKARRLGIDYRADSEHFSLLQLNRSDRLNMPSPDFARASVQTLGRANLVGSYVSDTWAVLAAIDMLEQKAVARSVAEPNVMTLTGEEATVVVGGEVPIPTTTSTDVSSTQGYDFQSFGVRLQIRPTADPDKIVTLEMAPSIVRPNQGLGVQDVPGFEVQTVQTVARVRSGQSLVVGGLIDWEERLQEDGIPVLGRIPILGAAFRWTERARTEKELLFVMTPRIMEDADEGMKEPVRMPSPRVIGRESLSAYGTAPSLTPSGLPSNWVEERNVSGSRQIKIGETSPVQPPLADTAAKPPPDLVAPVPSVEPPTALPPPETAPVAGTPATEQPPPPASPAPEEKPAPQPGPAPAPAPEVSSDQPSATAPARAAGPLREARVAAEPQTTAPSPSPVETEYDGWPQPAGKAAKTIVPPASASQSRLANDTLFDWFSRTFGTGGRRTDPILAPPGTTREKPNKASGWMAPTGTAHSASETSLNGRASLPGHKKPVRHDSLFDRVARFFGRRDKPDDDNAARDRIKSGHNKDLDTERLFAEFEREAADEPEPEPVFAPPRAVESGPTVLPPDAAQSWHEVSLDGQTPVPAEKESDSLFGRFRRMFGGD